MFVKRFDNLLVLILLLPACADDDPAGDTPTDSVDDWNPPISTAADSDVDSDSPGDTGASSSATASDTDTSTHLEQDTTTFDSADVAFDTETATAEMGGTAAPDTDTGALDSAGETGGELDTGEDWEDAGVCAELELDIERVPARVMILQDRSDSMNGYLPEGITKWTVAVDALSDLVRRFGDDIQFGLDLFTTIDSDDQCVVGDEVVADVAPENGPVIADILRNQVRPKWATPLLLALRNFTDADYAPTFLDGSEESYLVLVSDGMDSCGEIAMLGEDNATEEQLGEVAAQIVREMGLEIYVIGFGDGISPKQLNAIAEAGGTERTSYYDAADGDELNAVLNEIGETVATTCTYDIGAYDEDQVNLDYVNIKFNDTPIPWDKGCRAKKGWSWVDDSRTAVQFCDEACDMLTGLAVKQVTLSIACAIDDVIIVV